MSSTQGLYQELLEKRLPGLEIYNALKLLNQKVDKIMSALTDLQSAESAVAAAISSAVTLIQALAANSTGGVDSADVETVVGQLNAGAAALNAAVTAAQPPAPTSTTATPTPPASDPSDS